MDNTFSGTNFLSWHTRVYSFLFALISRYEWSYVGNGEGTTPARKSKAATSATVPQVSNAQPMQANEAKNHSDSVAAPHATTQDQNDAANADMSGLSDNKNSGATDTTAPAPALADPSGAASSSSSSSAIAPWGTATGMRADLRNLKPATVFEFRVRFLKYGLCCWCSCLQIFIIF